MLSLYASVRNVFNPLFKGLKTFFQGENHAGIISCFGSSRYQCGLQYIVTNARHVLSFVSFSLVFFVWLLVCPLVLRGEFTNTDSINLNQLTIQQKAATTSLSTINYDTGHIRSVIDDIYNGLGYFSGSSATHNLSLDMDNIVDKLDAIITALESLESGDSIDSDLLTETTFLEKYNEFSSAFGFGGSAGSLYTLLNTQAQNIDRIYQALGYDGTNLKTDVGEVLTALSTANTSLNSIISELESLNSKDFGGGSSSSEITQDWLKEATFTEKYNLLLNALGFGSGSNLSGSLNDILTVLNEIKNKDFSGGSSEVSPITQDWLKDSTFVEKWQTFSNGFGYSGGSSGGSLVDDIKTIISALETIDTTLKNDTGGSVVTDDLLKENTFVEKFDNFQSSFGFSGGSSGSLNDYLNSFYNPSSAKRVYLPSWLPGFGNLVPFPGNNDSRWPVLNEFGFGKFTTVEAESFSDFLSYLFYYNNLDARQMDLIIAEKQAWNDWQAHTNTVATLYNIFSMENESSLKFDEKTGIITVDTGNENTSSGNETYSIVPVATNSVETAVVAVTNTTDRLATIYVYEQVKNRYLNDSLLSVGKNYGIGESEGSAASAVWKTEWFTIDFSSWSASYRKFMPFHLLSKVRAAMSYLWTLVSAICCILLVRQWGNM